LKGIIIIIIITILWNKQLQTDRAITINTPDIVIRDNEKGTCILTDVAISGDRNVIQKEEHVECKHKGDTSNNWSDWNHFKIIQKIREHHTRKP
jgi:hypothetical protein